MWDRAEDVLQVRGPVLDEVAAFEELVGCHGGLGGWQTRPLLVYPAEWTVDEDLLDDRGRLRGAETVHRQLVRWLERLGQREDLPRDSAGISESEGPAVTASGGREDAGSHLGGGDGARAEAEEGAERA